METPELYRVNWQSERQEDVILEKLSNLKLDLLGMELSLFGNEDLDEALNIEDYSILFDNNVIKNTKHLNSNISIEATAALLIPFTGFGYFIIPPDLIKYIREEIPSFTELDRYVKNFPNSIDLYEQGKEIFTAMIEGGYPTQAAYSLTGATFTECTWNPNVYNKAESTSSAGTTKFAGGWKNCGEGLFGLTNWVQKKKIIDTLGLNISADMYAFENGKIIKDKKPARNGISNIESVYDGGPSATNPLLFQCTEAQWIEIMKQYIKDLGRGSGDDKSTYDYLMYDGIPQNSEDPNDDDHKLLYASYLFKAGNGYKKEFNSIIKCTDSYKSTHIRIYRKNNPSFKPKNGFVEQLL